jgi:hypothetical protein
MRRMQRDSAMPTIGVTCSPGLCHVLEGQSPWVRQRSPDALIGSLLSRNLSRNSSPLDGGRPPRGQGAAQSVRCPDASSPRLRSKYMEDPVLGGLELSLKSEWVSGRDISAPVLEIPEPGRCRRSIQPHVSSRHIRRRRSISSELGHE